VKIIWRSNDVSRIRCKRCDGVRRTAETRGEDDKIELSGITRHAFQSVGKVIYCEGPIRVRCIVTRAAEFRDFVAKVEEQSHQLRLFFRTEAIIELHLGIETRLSPITPVRFFGEEPSVPVKVKCSIMDREEEQEVSPVSFMKDEHLCLRVPFRDPFRSRQSLFICSVRITAGIMIEVATIAVDDAYD